MQEFEIPPALQALGRVGIQLVAMGLAGSITPLLLYAKPCVGCPNKSVSIGMEWSGSCQY
jgi:hypothetical protein